MRIVYFGSGQFAVPTLQALLEAGHEVAMVVTQPDRPAGRGRKMQPTPVGQIARQRGLRVLAVENVNEPAVTREILGLGARIGVVAAFGQKIGKALLEGFPAGLINGHASLLPKYRGAAPINWAILRGEDETGVTVFRLVEPMDAGPVLVMRRTAIKTGETAEELEARLGEMACDAVNAALEMFAGSDNPPMVAQDESKATRAPKLSRKDGYVDFADPAPNVARRVCGLWPWPGAACDFVKADGSRRERVILCRAETIPGDRGTTTALAGEPPVAPSDDRMTEALAGKPPVAPGVMSKPPVAPGGEASKPAPGTILADMSVQAGQGAIRISEMKPANGRRMSFEEFARGRRLVAGDRFETATPPPG
jgi:methionyl-tRNA formyltransferase